MKTKLVFFICVFTLFTFISKAQQFVNGDLEGPLAGINVLPPNWQNVPYTDVNCLANHNGMDTPDLTDSVDISASAGILGRPYSGLTFVSGMYGGDTANSFFQEGIMQDVTGLEIGMLYTISFHQSVVKQDNALDKSGYWTVYIDNTLAGATSPTYSEAVYNSISFVWEPRNITFTATAPSHLIKFLPVDDDTDTDYSLSDTTGALRMGIDAISLSSANGIKEYNPNLISVYPNPSKESFNIKLPNQQNFNLLVYDVTGKKVFQKTNATGTVNIDCRGFTSGIYFVHAVNERTILSCKLIKE